MQCGGYEMSIFFDFEVASEPGIPRFRRPLLTEEERQSMSECLTTAVSPRAVMRHLNNIDEDCDALSSSADVAISEGPFGAFRLAKNLEVSACGEQDLAEHFEDVDQEGEDPLALASGTFTPNTQMLFHSLLELPEEVSSSTLSMELAINESAHSRENLDNGDINFDFDAFQQQSTIPMTGHDFLFDTSGIDERFKRTSPSRSIDLSSGINTVPNGAVYLIKHYSTVVLTLLTPFQHSKTPWHVLFVPHAKSCLAALTLGESLDHASLCAFYAMLSISAFSLGGITQVSMWRDQGHTYLGTAREHVRLMLRTAYNYPKTAKYKHVLIALLCMVQLAIAIGNRDQAECYFVEAEKFIRMKGLNRNKSRKVRLLHHCYVFERMFHESTYLAGTNSPHRSHARRAIESSGALAYSQDSLSFRLGDLDNLEGQMLRVKCREEGENDLHLQIPGLWPNTLYPEIFGVPEKYVFALSLVIRLGQWRDEAQHGEAAAPLPLKDFLSRAKTVERYIKQLHRATQGQMSPSVAHSEASGPVLDDLLQAMCHALTIYFYRRIYNVDADMLQTHVVGVRDCLLRMESTEAGMSLGSARLLWPAFIAACEAEDLAVQASFTQWFQNSAVRSGLPYFDHAKSSIERVWKGSRSGSALHTTWIDLLGQESGTSSIH